MDLSNEEKRILNLLPSVEACKLPKTRKLLRNKYGRWYWSFVEENKNMVRQRIVALVPKKEMSILENLYKNEILRQIGFEIDGFIIHKNNRKA